LCSGEGGEGAGEGAGGGASESAEEEEFVICFVVSFDIAGFRSVHAVRLIGPSFEKSPERFDQSGVEDFVML
jgi:hypothetical protein